MPMLTKSCSRTCKFPFSSCQGDGMKRRLWRLQDLRDGGGLSFTVELFFLAFYQLLSTSPSMESHAALYTGTPRAITYDWSKHKDSPGTQRLLLDIAKSHHWKFRAVYPAYIVDQFMLSLGNVFKGRTGPPIDKAGQLFEFSVLRDSRRFRERMLGVLTRGQAQSLHRNITVDRSLARCLTIGTTIRTECNTLALLRGAGREARSCSSVGALSRLLK